MDSLPSETLVKIFSFCESDDRLIFESINNRIRACMRYAYEVDTILDVAYFETVCRRRRFPAPINSHQNRRSFSDDEDEEEEDDDSTRRRVVVISNEKTTTEDGEEYTHFVLRLFHAVLPKFQRNLRGVRFDDEADWETTTIPPIIIEKELLLALYEYAPNLTSLDFGRRSVRFDALKVLPHFTNLKNLRILNAGDQFREILVGRIRGLVDLELGGVQRSIKAMDVSALRRLVLHGTCSRKVTTKYPLPNSFPALEVFHIKPARRLLQYFAGLVDKGGYYRVDRRAEFFRSPPHRFPRLRRSNLFGRRDLNVASLLMHQVPAASVIRNVRVELPNAPGDDDIPQVQTEYARASELLTRSWPAFFERFANIDTLRICNANNTLNFRVADLFSLPVLLPKLRGLTLDGVKFTFEDTTRFHYAKILQFLPLFTTASNYKTTDTATTYDNAGCSTKDEKTVAIFQYLESLTIKRSTVDFSYPIRNESDVKQMAVMILRSVSVLNAFVQFVLSSNGCSSRLRKLHLECIEDGSPVWSSLIQYGKQFDDEAAAARGIGGCVSACTLETLRVACRLKPGLPRESPRLPLAELASVTWPRLREFRVDHDYPPTTNQFLVIGGGDGNSPRFSGGADLARAFPRLRVFSLPYTENFEAVYDAVLECRRLRRIIIHVYRDPIDLSRWCNVISRRRWLERIDLVRLKYYSPTKIPERGEEAYWEPMMFEKRRIVRASCGLRESQLKLVKVVKKKE